LRQVACEIGRIDLPQRRRIDQVGMPRDNFAKGGFLPAFKAGPGDRSCISPIKHPPAEKSDKDFQGRFEPLMDADKTRIERLDANCANWRER
jgi:hypothetical protein